MDDNKRKGEVIEKDVIIAFKGGDKAAFEKIFRLYHKRLYSFCFSFIKNKAEAENLTQDVFLKLWLKRKTLDCDKSLDGFLFTMIRNLALNHIRSTIKRQILIGRLLKNNIILYNPIEEELSFNETKHKLDVLIGQLPPKRKKIFLLSREDGFSHLEIAQQMGISIHTVESQITKALKFIRNELKNTLLLFLLFLLFFFF